MSSDSGPAFAHLQRRKKVKSEFPTMALVAREIDFAYSSSPGRKLRLSPIDMASDHESAMSDNQVVSLAQLELDQALVDEADALALAAQRKVQAARTKVQVTVVKASSKGSTSARSRSDRLIGPGVLPGVSSPKPNSNFTGERDARDDLSSLMAKSMLSVPEEPEALNARNLKVHEEEQRRLAQEEASREAARDVDVIAAHQKKISDLDKVIQDMRAREAHRAEQDRIAQAQHPASSPRADSNATETNAALIAAKVEEVNEIKRHAENVVAGYQVEAQNLVQNHIEQIDAKL